MYFIDPMGRPFSTTTAPQTVACYMESWPQKHSTECEDAEEIQIYKLSSRHSLFGCQEQLQRLTSREWCLLATEVPVGVLFRSLSWTSWQKESKLDPLPQLLNLAAKALLGTQAWLAFAECCRWTFPNGDQETRTKCWHCTSSPFSSLCINRPFLATQNTP